VHPPYQANTRVTICADECLWQVERAPGLTVTGLMLQHCDCNPMSFHGTMVCAPVLTPSCNCSLMDSCRLWQVYARYWHDIALCQCNTVTTHCKIRQEGQRGLHCFAFVLLA
jgi:hypothetical protein